MRRFAVLVAMLVPLSLFAARCSGGGGGGPAVNKKTEAEKQAAGMYPGKMGKTLGMVPQQDKGAGVPDKTPTPEK